MNEQQTKDLRAMIESHLIAAYGIQTVADLKLVMIWVTPAAKGDGQDLHVMHNQDDNMSAAKMAAFWAYQVANEVAPTTGFAVKGTRPS